MCAVLYVGVDVSAKTFDVCLQEPGRRVAQVQSYPNTSEGHRRLVGKIHSLQRSGNDLARVCLESTGVYSVDLSWHLAGADNIEVMVVNPRAMAKFREALAQRNKGDREDAELALEFAERMEFEPWKAPAKDRVALRLLARRIRDLVSLGAQEKCRLHAAEGSEEIPELLRRDIAEHIGEIDRRVERLRKEALQVIADSQELSRRMRLMTTIKGIGEVSGIQILSELAILPDGLKAKQWVAWTGLDPIRFESGTSVRREPHISRRGSEHLRQALFLPAMTAIRYEPAVKVFYEQLLGCTSFVITRHSVLGTGQAATVRLTSVGAASMGINSSTGRPRA